MPPLPVLSTLAVDVFEAAPFPPEEYKLPDSSPNSLVEPVSPFGPGTSLCPFPAVYDVEAAFPLYPSVPPSGLLLVEPEPLAPPEPPFPPTFLYAPFPPAAL